MKVPVPPPDWMKTLNDLTVGARSSVAGLRPLVGIGTRIGITLRHLPAPIGLNPRRVVGWHQAGEDGRLAPLPLLATDGEPFSFMLPDPAWRCCIS